MDVKQQCQALFKRAQTQFEKVISSIEQSISIKLQNFRQSYENQLQQYLTTMANNVSQDDVDYEVNAFRYEIKQTMGELNKFLIYLSSYKLTSLMSKKSQKYCSIKKDVLPVELISDEEQVDKEIPPYELKMKKKRMIQCDFCCHNFSRHAGYKFHLKEKHQKVTTFVCPQCNYLESNVALMATHMLQQHLTQENTTSKWEMKYICPFSQDTFTSLIELGKYINNHPKYLRVVGGKSLPIQEFIEEQSLKLQKQVDQSTKLQEAQLKNQLSKL